MFYINLKKPKLKTVSAVCTGSRRNYVKYVSFPWPPVAAAHNRKRHEQCIATDVVALDKLSLYPTFSYVRQSLPVPFKLCRRRFAIKVAFDMTFSKAQGKALQSVAICLPSLFFPYGQLYVAFNCSSSFDSIGVAMRV